MIGLQFSWLRGSELRSMYAGIGVQPDPRGKLGGQLGAPCFCLHLGCASATPEFYRNRQLEIEISDIISKLPQHPESLV